MSQNKKLTQQDLRKAMYDHKKKAGLVKKIDSPLAKYTETGQLMCIICKSIVRSEAVWIVHTNTKVHKENVELAKKKLLEDSKVSASKSTSNSSLKRPPSPTKIGEVSTKKVKGILKNSSNTKTSIHSALPADFFDSAPSNGKAVVVDTIAKTTDRNLVNNNSKIADNHADSTPMETDQGQETELTLSTVLPEGFFDDPVLDARVRNVEYKDPIEEEWDRYLKEIREETAQSAQLIAEDHEEATNERQLDEIDEQLNKWSIVMNLVKYKEQIKIKPKKVETIMDDSSGDETDYDEFLDWRSKNS